jgi:hypothetical protein
VWQRQHLGHTFSVLEDVLPSCDLLQIGTPGEHLQALRSEPPAPLICSSASSAKVQVRQFVLRLVVAKKLASAALRQDSREDVRPMSDLAERLFTLADRLRAMRAPGAYAGAFVWEARKVLNALEFIFDGDDFHRRLREAARISFWSSSVRDAFSSILEATATRTASPTSRRRC